MVYVHFQTNLKQSYINNTILAVLFLDHEVEQETDTIFEEIFKTLRNKLYDILCLLTWTSAGTTEAIITQQRNIRDTILNEVMSDSRDYERSLFVIGGIRRMLQIYSSCRN